MIEETPASLVLQLKTAPSGAADKAGAPAAEPVLRRFQLLPTIEEEQLVGFSWREVDAERQVGSLYFTRAGK